MIVVESRKALIALSVLAVGLIPFFFLTMPQTPIGLEFWPVVIAAEFLVYSLFAMISAPSAGWRGAGYVALMCTIARFLLCLAGGMLLSFSPHYELPTAIQLLYASNPLSILLQMLAILTLSPHLLQRYVPGLLSIRDTEPSREDNFVAQDIVRPANALPVGGYVQVYSYEELVEFLKKIVGIEGFLFYSDEGFALISHFPFAINQETAAVASNQMLEQVQSWGTQLHVDRMDRFIVETADHYVVNASVLPRVRFLAYFTRSTPVEVVLNRVELIRRTSAEFMRSRVTQQKKTLASVKD